ncbi:gamma-glutamyltransferase [Paracoccus sediminicola]|uniref:gamma-glutamyltransferase n=1 Tax=Paracoccus sediminicola TaxID=3017783 RepID=UPI0022F12DCD|nr:gamma-glutamyltransferase [Paracoccus sediminicola]WBU57767.1 gamma-glutamyltransferase [Paracoccus sediminicola]
MTSSLSRTQIVRKTVPKTRAGVVAAQNSRAARIGAQVLAEGGNAVDAAVAVSFAIGVLEPWMSGPAGGGAMMLWHGDAGRAETVFYGMRAPSALDPADYPLAGTGKAGDLFPWDAVVGDRNIRGGSAVAVPGVVDGIGEAHARYGRMPWRELLAPAIKIAREGLPVDWYAALMIASATRGLAEDPDAAAMFLEDGQWPTVAGWTSTQQKTLSLDGMAATLSEIAEQGHRALYDGDLGASLARDMQEKGSRLSHGDLRDYHAEFQTPLSFARGAARFHVTPHLTAGPTFRDIFAALPSFSGQPDAAAFSAFAEALKSAYAARLDGMGDDGESPAQPGSTTHFAITDRDGNMVSMTQTLLSAFGAHTVSPSTGLLMNNGIMWFDPVPGRRNSLAPGKRCLMNVCPVIGETGSRRFAFGASGGRKIVGAVAQLSSFVADFGMDLEAAFHHGRIDVSGGDLVTADESLPAELLRSLSERHDVTPFRRTVFPYAFACPAGIMRDGEINSGCTEIMSPWGDAIAEPETQP